MAIPSDMPAATAVLPLDLTAYQEGAFHSSGSLQRRLIRMIGDEDELEGCPARRWKHGGDPKNEDRERRALF
jgi:hypothetical protein